MADKLLEILKETDIKHETPCKSFCPYFNPGNSLRNCQHVGLCDYQAEIVAKAITDKIEIKVKK